MGRLIWQDLAMLFRFEVFKNGTIPFRDKDHFKVSSFACPEEGQRAWAIQKKRFSTGAGYCLEEAQRSEGTAESDRCG